MYEKRTTPGTIGKVLDNAFQLFAKSFVFCVPASILVALANTAPQLINVTMLPFEQPALLGVLLFVGYCLIAISMPTLIHRMNGFADGTRPSFGANLAFGARKSPFVLGGFILYFLAVAGGIILLIVPGAILSVSLSLFLYAMVVDGSGAVQALIGSHRLVWGNWWRTVAIFSVGIALAMVLYLIAGAVFGLIAAFTLSGDAIESGTGFQLGLLAIAALVNFLMTPLFTALGLAVYVDLDLRKRGRDLEARVDELQTA